VRLERALLAVTCDRQRPEIGTNIGSITEAQLAVESGAESVGLFRTEFLFLDRTDGYRRRQTQPIFKHGTGGKFVSGLARHSNIQLKIMFPMIFSLEGFRRAKSLLAEAVRLLVQDWIR